MNNKHLTLLDEIRGGAIILVVLGHISVVGSTPYWYKIQNDIIYSFHMVLLFGVSGFLFGYKEWHTKPQTIIKRKLLNLGIPYLMFDLIYVIFNVIMQKYVNTNTTINLIDGLQFWRYPSAHYWFLYALLFYFIIASLLKKYLVLYTAIGFLTAVFYIGGSSFGFDGFIYYKEIVYYFAFSFSALIGHFFSTKEEHPPVELKNKYIIYILFSVLVVSFEIGMWIVGERKDTTDIIAFGLNFLHVILMLLRIVAFILIINLTCKVKFLQKFIEFMGTRTWYIYLLHSYFIAATRIIVKKFEMEAIPQIILGLLMGIGAPLLISVIVKKIWILDLFFYPGKYTNKIKK